MDAPQPTSTTLADALLDRAERYLETYFARLFLSALILLSLLPLDLLAERMLGLSRHQIAAESVNLVFFCIFAPEFIVRLAVHARRRKARKLTRGEGALLALDLIATLSFLPIWTMFSLSALRLARLTRMVVLLGYWGAMIRDLIRVVTGRERRVQIAFVALLGVVLSFAGAVMLWEFGFGVGADGNVAQGRDGEFEETLWWSFRQVQDPGNLVQALDDAAVVAVSVFLTFSGLVLFSFVIGIGTSTIDELMRLSRTRPVGMRNHTVVLGLGPHTHFLLSEFHELYAKNRRRFRAVVLGPTPEPPESMTEDLLRWYQYRTGDPVRAGDLDRLDITDAKRVLILGTDPEDPDAEVISAILATRDRNPDVDLYPSLDHQANLAAARTAGGRKTHIIGSGSFLGNYLAQNVIFPGAYRIYRQLLTSAGCEIYTYHYTEEDRARLCKTTSAPLDPGALHAQALREHGVNLLGFFVAPEGTRDPEVEDLDVAMLPDPAAQADYAFDDHGAVRPECLRGLIGISLRWNALRKIAVDLTRGRVPLERMAAPTDFTPLSLKLPATRTRRVLVCGGSERVPRVVSELLTFYGKLEVTVLVRREGRVGTLLDALVTAFERTLRTSAEVERQSGRVLVRVTIQGRVSTITIEHADWTDTTRIVHQPDVDVATTDVLLFMPSRETSHEADGLVALDCLQLADSLRHGDVDFPEEFRVVGMVNDPIKGDLLEKRLDAMAKDRPRTTFTIICGERIRHYFTVQSVFVNGLSKVFLDLLDADSQGLCRVLPRTADGGPPTGSFRPYDLARHLYLAHGFVFLGIERNGADGRAHATLDPEQLRNESPVDWSTVRGLFVLGDARPLLGNA